MINRYLTTMALVALLAGTSGCVSIVAKTTDLNRQTNMVRERTTLLNVHTDGGAIIRLYETGDSDSIPIRVLQVYSKNTYAKSYNPEAATTPHHQTNPDSQTPEVQNP